MFRSDLSLEALTAHSKNTAADHLGIEYVELGTDYIVARMPVDARTRQPYGILHGGASVLLAETLGSVAAFACLPNGKVCVGLEINANHLRSVKSGWVYGKATPIHVGRSTHVWEIKITNEAEALVCISRITMAVLDVA